MNKILIASAILLAFSACAQKKVVYDSPKGYDFNKPEKYELPDELFEISGIAFEKGNSDLLYAQQDESGHIYTLRLGDKTAQSVMFGGKGDYEDLAIFKEHIIMMKSNGTLYVMPLAEVKAGKVATIQEFKGLVPKGEYEGLYADEQANYLYLLCKSCKEDKKQPLLSGYRAKIDDNGVLSAPTRFTIDTKEIKHLAGDNEGVKATFKPSALAFNSKTNEWFLLSSVNKMLVVADIDWQVKQVFALNAKLFTQPEGMAFDNIGNLYIANEGATSSHGTVLKFSLQ